MSFFGLNDLVFERGVDFIKDLLPFIKEQTASFVYKRLAQLHQHLRIGDGARGDQIDGTRFELFDAAVGDRHVFQPQIGFDKLQKAGAFLKRFAEDDLGVGKGEGENHSGKTGTGADVENGLDLGQKGDGVDGVIDELVDQLIVLRSGQIVDPVPFFEMALVALDIGVEAVVKRDVVV